MHTVITVNQIIEILSNILLFVVLSYDIKPLSLNTKLLFLSTKFLFVAYKPKTFKYLSSIIFSLHPVSKY
jgi:hypothetical protein